MLTEAFANDVQMPFKKIVEVFFCRMDETANIAVKAQVSVYSLGERKLKRGGRDFLETSKTTYVNTGKLILFLSPSVQFIQLQQVVIGE